MGDGRPGFRADINGLRALAVVLVVGFHLGVKGLGRGYLGVDVFFVISGYLMTRIISDGLHAGTFSYGRFLAARAARIWPPLAVTLLACLVVGALLLPPSDLVQVAKQAWAAATFTSNHYFLDNRGAGTLGDKHWLIHTWSLSVEWQFYVLYPLVLLLAARLSRSAPGVGGSDGVHGPRGASVVLVPIAVASFAAYAALTVARHGVAFYLMPTRVWAFVAGGLVHAAPRGSLRLRRTLGHVGVVLIVAFALSFGQLRASSIVLVCRSIVPVVGAMLVLASDGAPNALLDNQVARALGLASYSIYLVHWPVVVAFSVFEGRPSLSGPARLGAIAVSVPLAWLLYRSVELPWRRRRDVAGPRTWRRAGVLLVAAGAASLTAVATRGLEFRRGPAAADLASPREGEAASWMRRHDAGGAP
jgi:peptidoglycan/LPS O-acetylase OafA/YrhL